MSPGSKLGHYEVLAQLGAGGMGEVYRARDPKLNRDVAIKVLPEAFAKDAERLARFQREAQVLAALNHPNIAQIFGMEGPALVMEYVPGDSPKGPLPLETALNYARQVAEALEAAHEKGIVHRDLKPANIKVTPEGVVKVLDFGLAKAMEESPTEIGNSPTMSLAATRAGLILGTAGYMSPEQAAGRPTDRRADIWSFGVVLWELLTGKMLFEGETVSHTLASVLKDQISFDLPEVPAPIRDLLARCLDRSLKNRLRDIGEARIAIDKYLANPAPQTAAAAPVAAAPQRKPRLAWAVAAVATVAAIVLGAAYWRATRPVPHPLMRLSVELGGDAALARVRAQNMFAISPDGTRLALTFRASDGRARLGTRLLHQSQITPLSGTDEAGTPFFSPDGQWIGFFADGKLKKIAVDGGAAVTICAAAQARGASWGDDGNIVFSPGPTVALVRVSSDGGTPAPLTKLNQGEHTHRWPQVLPGSQAVLFTSSDVANNYDGANIEVFSIKTGERKTIRRGGHTPRYLPSNIQAGALCRDCGYLVYLHETTLFGAPFDLRSLAMTGAPMPMLEDVASNSNGGGDFAFSQTGTFVYLVGQSGGSGVPISWLDVAGKREVAQLQGRYFTPRLSPDGKRLAFTTLGQSEDIWVKDLERNTPSRVSFLGGINRFPVWTPDGRSIVFVSSDANKPGMYWIHSDGSGEAVRLTDGKFQESPYSFSPDGKRLAFHRIAANGLPDIYTARIEGDATHPQLGKPEVFLATDFAEACPMFSLDGRWLAYSSNESGSGEVFVRPFPGPGGRWQVSAGGGRFPHWSRDGKELIFEKADGTIMAVGYTAKGDAFTVGVPRVWSPGRVGDQATFPTFDLAPDGKRIIGFLQSEATEGPKLPTHLTFLLNFSDELRRRTSGK